MIMDYLIQGSGGGGKGGGSSKSATEDPNTLRAKSYAYCVDLIGEGEMQLWRDPTHPLKYVYLNETPVQNDDNTLNFVNVEFDFRVGTSTQLGLPGDTVESPLPQGGAPFRGVTPAYNDDNHTSWPSLPALPYIREITDTDAEGIRVIVSIAALTSQNTSTGDLHGNSVDVRIEIRQTTGSDTGWHEYIHEVISGKCVSPYQQAWGLQLPQPGPWQIRVSRDTTEPTLSSEQRSTSVVGIIKLLYEKYSYPRSAVVAMAIDSEYFPGGEPQRAYLVLGLKILYPSCYDPLTRQYSSGIWDGSWAYAWCNNPAWVFYDLVTNPIYGLGDIIDASQVDHWGLFEIAKYCDGYNARPANANNDYGPNGKHGVSNGSGGFEPRFVFNGALNTAQDHYKAIQAIVGMFQGITYWGSGSVMVVQDSPSDVVQLVAPANVKDGIFSYTTSALVDRHSVCLVQFQDPLDFYRASIETVENADALQKYGYRETRITAVGCTSRSQARRLGTWLLETEYRESEMVGYTCDLDHLRCRPGQVIAIADPAVQGDRMGGRIVGGTTTSVILDAPVTLEGSDQLMLVRTNGTIMEAGVSYVANPQTTLSLLSTLPEAPTAGNMWALIGGITKPTLWRVTSVRMTAPNQFEVAATSRDPTKFPLLDFDITIPQPVITKLSDGIMNPPYNFQAVENLYKSNNMTKNRLTISWEVPKDSHGNHDVRVTGYVVDYIGPTLAGWARLATMTTNGYEIDDAKAGDYQFRVTSVSLIMPGTTLTTDVITLLGKSAPPQDVTNFVGIGQLSAHLLSWDAATDIDLVGYDVKEGTSWDTGDLLSARMKGTTLLVPVSDAVVHDYMIKAIDDSGNYSLHASSIPCSVIPPISIAVFSAQPQGDSVRLDWLYVPGIDVEYELRAGASWEFGQFIARTSANQLTVLFPGQGVKTFWIRSVSKLGVYSATPIFAQADLDVLANRNSIYVDDFAAAGFTGHRNNVGLEVSGSGALVIQTNMLAATSTFAAGWTPSDTVLTTLSTTAYDGRTVAAKIVEDSSSATHTVQSSTTVVLAGGVYTFTCDVKALGTGSARYFAIVLDSTSFGGIGNIFNVGAGTITHSDTGIIAPTIEALSGGWYKCSVSAACTQTSVCPVNFTILTSDSDYATPYTGDGVSGVYVAYPLVSRAGAEPRGEYFEEIDIGNIVTARNWLDTDFLLFDSNTLTWQTADFAWNSVEAAATTWVSPGTGSGAWVDRLISTKSPSLPISLIEGWELNGNLTPVVGVGSTVSRSGDTYAPHLIRNGLVMGMGGEVVFGLSIPTTFAMCFTIKVSGLSGGHPDLFRLSSTGGAYTLRVSRELGSTLVLHRVGARNSALPGFTLAADDIVTVGIIQTATVCTLAAYSVRQRAFYSYDVALSPLGTFDRLSLLDAGASVPTVYGNIAVYSVPPAEDQINTFLWENVSPLGYDAFRSLIPGDYTYQHAIVGLFLGAPAGVGRPGFTTAILNVDLPDVHETGTVTCSSGGWVTVTLHKRWMAPPKVMLYQATGANIAVGEVQSITTTSFQARLRQSDGTVITGSADYICNGY